MAVHGPIHKAGAAPSRIPMHNLLSLGQRPLSGVVTTPATKPDLTGWMFFWKMDEGTGTTVYDTGDDPIVDLNLALNKRGGSIFPQWVPGYYGTSALEFYSDGVTDNAADNASVAQSRTLGTAGASFTIVTHLTSDVGEDGGTFPTIISQHDYLSGADQNGFRLHWDYAASGLTFYVANGSSSSTTLSVPLATAGLSVGVPAVIMAVFDNPNNQIRLYVDGVNVGSAAAAFNVGYQGTEYIAIGHTGDPSLLTSPAWGFDGIINWLAVDSVAYDDTAAAAFYAGLNL